MREVCNLGAFIFQLQCHGLVATSGHNHANFVIPVAAATECARQFL